MQTYLINYSLCGLVHGQFHVQAVSEQAARDVFRSVPEFEYYDIDRIREVNNAVETAAMRNDFNKARSLPVGG
jgi:hypothetical protein